MEGLRRAAGDPWAPYGRGARLTEKDVRFILERGGSILGSTVVRIPSDDEATIHKMAETLKKLDLEVASLFRGADARPGGLLPVSFYRQNQGLLSGYRPLAEL